MTLVIVVSPCPFMIFVWGISCQLLLCVIAIYSLCQRKKPRSVQVEVLCWSKSREMCASRTLMKYLYAGSTSAIHTRIVKPFANKCYLLTDEEGSLRPGSSERRAKAKIPKKFFQQNHVKSSKKQKSARAEREYAILEAILCVELKFAERPLQNSETASGNRVGAVKPQTKNWTQWSGVEETSPRVICKVVRRLGVLEGALRRRRL